MSSPLSNKTKSDFFFFFFFRIAVRAFTEAGYVDTPWSQDITTSTFRLLVVLLLLLLS